MTRNGLLRGWVLFVILAVPIFCAVRLGYRSEVMAFAIGTAILPAIDGASIAISNWRRHRTLVRCNCGLGFRSSEEWLAHVPTDLTARCHFALSREEYPQGGWPHYGTHGEVKLDDCVWQGNSAGAFYVDSERKRSLPRANGAAPSDTATQEPPA